MPAKKKTQFVPNMDHLKLTVWLGKHITVNPKIQGGQPCVDETRVRVVDVLDYVAEGYSFKEVAAAYHNWFDEEAVKECIEFAAKAMDAYYDEQRKKLNAKPRKDRKNAQRA